MRDLGLARGADAIEAAAVQSRSMKAKKLAAKAAARAEAIEVHNAAYAESNITTFSELRAKHGV